MTKLIESKVSLSVLNLPSISGNSICILIFLNHVPSYLYFSLTIDIWVWRNHRFIFLNQNWNYKYILIFPSYLMLLWWCHYNSRSRQLLSCHFGKLFFHFLQLLGVPLCVSVSPGRPLVSLPALRTRGHPGLAAGADQVLLLAHEDRGRRRLQAHGARQLCLLFLNGIEQKGDHPFVVCIFTGRIFWILYLITGLFTLF